MRKKKWVLYAAALAAALAVSGCAGPQGGSEASRSGGEAAEAVSERAEAASDAVTSPAAGQAESVGAGTAQQAGAASDAAVASAENDAASGAAASPETLSQGASTASASSGTASFVTAASGTAQAEAAPIDTPVPAKKKKNKKKKATPTPEADPDAGYDVIGTKDSSDAAWRVPIRNETYSGIVYLSVKNADDGEYPENFFGEGERLEHDETGIFYFTPADKTALYNVKLQLDDGTICYMTALPFGDMASARIEYDEGLVYMVYESKESGEVISTREAELEWLARKNGDMPEE